ncbi:MAG TPA: DUF945 family protein [Epsilonproteobacteria bacterium]|nr:DUF945 family protein [Campylobacterota bacterium]
MKKPGFGIIGLILVAALYYFTAGSAQITEEMKKQVNDELTTLQQNGFGINGREIKETEEHFVFSFDEPAKITHYLSSQGAQVEQEDILALKGLKIGVDAKYLNDSYSALSLDIYPVGLPESMLQEIEEEDKAALERIKKMMSDKTLLVHLDFNKLLSGFKGQLKDINETFEEEGKVTFVSKGFKFEGDIENEKVKTVRQTLELFSVEADKELTMKLSNFTSNYTLSGPSPYDSKSGYTVEEIKIQGEPEFSMLMKNLNVNAVSSIKNDLLSSSIISKADELKITEEQKKYRMDDILFDFKIENLDIASFEALQGIDTEDEKAINALSQKILSKGIILNIPSFSVKKISENGKTMDGFMLSSSLAIDKAFDINATSQNPLAILNALSTKTKLSVSTELFARIAQEPRAMMLLMLLPPVEKEGKKIYEIEFIKGKITVNGASF